MTKTIAMIMTMTPKRGIKIAMFSNLSDEADNPDGCGSNIAYAYFTTFFVSPLICDPCR